MSFYSKLVKNKLEKMGFEEELAKFIEYLKKGTDHNQRKRKSNNDSKPDYDVKAKKPLVEN